MIKVAILGYGIVGSGVAEVLRENAKNISENAGQDIVVEKILDVRDFEDSPDAMLITKDPDEIFENNEIRIIVETIGGAGIAYEFTKRALASGKSVVTSNKELVATHGPELLQLAKDHKVSYMFEASVGGGIPIIRPIQQCLAANRITGILGILNGTTNYILSKMRLEGKDFSDALKEAQLSGYAEANPTADIEGHDSCRKIAILSSLSYGEMVDYRKISTVGITKISLVDMKYAERLGRIIKLLAMSRKYEEGVYARVSPVMLPVKHSLANVEDVFNGIMVRGNAVGDAMFYGKGAGKLPTASAVVADIIDIVKHHEITKMMVWKLPVTNNVLDIRDFESAWFVRLEVSDKQAALEYVEKTIGNVSVVTLKGYEQELAFTTSMANEGFLLQAIHGFEGKKGIRKLISLIRLY
ncbi:MAG: homoserine dehydrogenase [Clostridia bacterium]